VVTGPLDEAFVEVGADVSRADRDLDALHGDLEAIEAIAAEVGEAVEAAFRDAFRDIIRASGLATDRVEGEFTEMGAEVDAILASVGGPELFAAVVASAEAAGEEVENSFQEAERTADEALRGIGGAGVFAPVAGEAEVAAEEIEHSFRDSANDAERSLTRLGFSGSGALQLISRGARLTGLALAALAAGTLAFGIKGAASLEQTQIGFEALLGSAKEADAFIREMQQFAAETPFEFQGLADNARKLLAIADAAGLARNEIIPTIGTIGDLTSVLGAPPDAIDRVVRALGQMASRGKVSTQELLQLSEALPGFAPFQALADGLGVSTAELQKMVESGAIPAQQGIELLLQGMREFPGAAGAMAKQAQTLSGVFSTFKDTIQISLTNAFQPLIPTIKQVLKDAIPVLDAGLNQLAPPLSSIAGTLLQSLLGIFQGIAPGLGIILTGLGNGLASLLPAINLFAHDLTTAFAPLGGLLTALGPALAPFITVIGDIGATVLPPFIAGLEGIVRAMTPILQLGGELFGILADALAPVVSSLAGLLGHLGAVAGRFFDVFDSSVISSFVPVFEALVDGLARFIALVGPPLQAAIKAILPPLVELVELLATGLADILQGVLVPLLPALGVAFAEIAKAIGLVLPPIIDLVTLLVGQLVPIVEELAPIIGEVLADAVRVLAKVFLQIAEAIAPVIPSIGEVIEALGGALLDVVKALEPVLPELGEAFGELALALADILIALVPLIPPLAKLIALLITELGAPILVALAKAFAILAIALADVVTVVAQLAGFIANNAGPALLFLWNDVIVPFAGFLQDTFFAAIHGIADVFTNVVVPAVQTLGQIALWLWNTVLMPLASFLETVLKPVLIALAVVAFGPLAIAITAVSIAANALWNFVLFPLGQFLVATFGPILTTLAQVGFAVLKIAIDGVTAAATWVWQNVLVPLGHFLQAVFAVAVAAGTSAWNAFKSAVGFVVDVLSSVWHSYIEPVAKILKGGLVDALHLAADAWGVVKSAIDAVVGVVKTVIGVIKDAIDLVGDLIDKVKSIPGGGILGDAAEGLGKIGGALGLAHGGIITADGLRFLHAPEVVIPTDNDARALELMAQTGLLDLAGRSTRAATAGSTGGGVDIPTAGTVINIEAHIHAKLTAAEARAAGREIGEGAAEVLDKRDARVQARIA
jgi:tape measure domain-containing protein